MSDQGGGVPEGWYEDPGAPGQLRWWTGGSWSEHVAPLMGTGPSVGVAVAEPVEEHVAPVEPQPTFAEPAYTGHGRDDDLQPMTTGAVPYHTGALRPGWEFIPTRGSTFSVWMLAISPLVSMGIAVLAILILTRGLDLVGQALGVLAIPTIWAIAFTLLDLRSLRQLGHEQTAHWAWILLGPIAYLIARTVVMRRYAGIGSAPLWVFLANSVVAFIGTFVMVGAFTFATQMEQADAATIRSIEANLKVELVTAMVETGTAPSGDFSVDCPDDASTEPGSVFACPAVGQTGTIAVVTVTIRDGGIYEYVVTELQ